MPDSAPTILMVDDDRTSLRLAQAMLNESGFQVHIVDDSRQAIDEIRRIKPRVLLVDICMPHVDGYAVAREVRGDPELAEIVIIAVTTLNGQEHERTSSAAGIDLQLTKPFDQAGLRNAILVGGGDALAWPPCD